MKSLVLIILVLVAAKIQNLPEQNNTGDKNKAEIYHGTGKASFFSEAPIQNIDAHSTELKSELNIATNEIAFVIPMRSFQFKNGKMQEDFNENYLESDKYPQATYKGTIQNKIDWTKAGTYKLISKGVLTIHNVPKERTDTATANITNDKIYLKGTFPVRIADHQIKIPTLVVQKIAEVVTVKFETEYTSSKESARGK